MRSPEETTAPEEKKSLVQRIRLEWSHYVYEFFIVALGISVPFLLDRWNSNIQERKAEQQIYANIQRELREDLSNIRGNMNQNQTGMEQYRYGSYLIRQQDRNRLDTLAHIALNLSEISDFHRSSNIYESLVNSGEIHLVENQEILQLLQGLEEQYIYINRLEGNHLDFFIDETLPELLQHMQISPVEVMDPDWFYTFHLNNFLQVSIALGEEKQAIYEKTESKLQQGLDLLSRELVED